MARIGDEKITDGPIKCPVCDKYWHGEYGSGLFQFQDGYWYHWCHSAYNVCIIKEKDGNE